MAGSGRFGLLAFSALTGLATPLIAHHLRGRVAKGKEHPTRWREKLGRDMAPRPGGRLIWMHAVGLGEVLALRGLIDRLAAADPGLSFLVTSNTRASGEVFAANLPSRTIHQFAPVDAPGPARRFLDHWRPDLSIWAEQDLWPGLVARVDRLGVPLALVNARMDAESFVRRQKGAALFGNALRRFAVISAQDDGTADHLVRLGAGAVRVDGSLKPLAPPLQVDAGALVDWQARAEGRFVWVVGSSHPEDEALALDAHRHLLKARRDAVLILAPRRPERGAEVLTAVLSAGFSAALRSAAPAPETLPQVYVADTFGEMGLWYRLASAVFLGGTMGAVEGHNPWEAASLGTPVLHGPRTANFNADYRALDSAGAALEMTVPVALANALTSDRLADLTENADRVRAEQAARLDDLCEALLGFVATSR